MPVTIIAVGRYARLRREPRSPGFGCAPTSTLGPGSDGLLWGWGTKATIFNSRATTGAASAYRAPLHPHTFTAASAPLVPVARVACVRRTTS